MTETDRLRDLLAQTAPAAPDLPPAERTGAVVRRGRTVRRRDRALVVGAAAAVLAVAVAVPLALRSDDGPSVATPTERTTATLASCPDRAVDVSEPLGSSASASVVAVRSCPTRQGDETRPADPAGVLLGEHADSFVAAVRALPAYRPEAFCATASIGFQPWALVVETEAGAREVVALPARACRPARVGGVERDPGVVLDTFTEALAAQADLVCPTGDRLVEGVTAPDPAFDLATASSGLVCYRVDPLGSRVYADLAGVLSADGVATVRDDAVTRIGPEPRRPPNCVDTGPQRLLLLLDAEGDRAAYLDERCSGGFTGSGGYWEPGTAAEGAIAAALGGPVRGGRSG
ncbi:hypothetical protein [Nocardioides dongkuii]|uniref:hypothetical protein n=1 Tax=Nocardioides dongkuii TaxID=2760089 RepID=UPI0015FB61BB|nr:hypothetical protein [Nocardioides dongkuii]